MQLQKIKHHKANWQKYINSRILLVVIGVLTVFNLGANLFNSYMAFTGKADQKKLREAQVQILSNIDHLEKLQIKQDASEVRADDSDKRQTASDTRQNKSDVRQTKSEVKQDKMATNANK